MRNNNLTERTINCLLHYRYLLIYCFLCMFKPFFKFLYFRILLISVLIFKDDYEDPYSTINQQNTYPQSLLQKSPNARQLNQPLQLPHQNSFNQNSYQVNNTNSYQRFHANSLNSNNSNDNPPRKTVQINSNPESRDSIRKPNQNTVSSSNGNTNFQPPLSTKRGTFRN